MGQCVNKCKNPTSSLGSKSGEKDAGKSHGKKGSGGGGGPREEAKFPADVNGTKSPEVTTDTSTTTHFSDVRREETAQDGEVLSMARIDEMFMHYKDEHEDAILEEGMERFCNDLHVDPAEFKVLVLAWKFQAATMCKFTRHEFVEGCKAIRADSVQGISQRFSAMLDECRSEENFKDLYRFTFQFGLDCGEGQRSLQRCIAIALWRLVFTQDMPPVLDRWLRFLSENPCGVRGISRDTWNMFLNFTQSVGPDLSNYSEDEAWPSLFDSFVEWENDRHRREQDQQETEGESGNTEFTTESVK